MNTLHFRPEILVAGLIHLIWIVLAVLLLFGIPPSDLMCVLSNIGAGTAILIIAAVTALSFLLGTLFEQIFIAIIYHVKPSKRENIGKSEMDSAWNSKSFFRSLATAFLILPIILAFINNEYYNGSHIWKIIIIGLVIECFTVLVWLTTKKKINESKKINNLK